MGFDDLRPERAFFVSVYRKPKVGLLAGPFATHEAALGMVDAARREACTIDPWCDFDAFGTLSLTAPTKLRGRLNERLGVEVRP